MTPKTSEHSDIRYLAQNFGNDDPPGSLTPVDSVELLLAAASGAAILTLISIALVIATRLVW